MQAWALHYLADIVDRSDLIKTIGVYFEHNQNVQAAARDLGIYHNTLRYRLSKIEEILDISLRSPSAIASVFLALTALQLGPDGSRNLPVEKVPNDTDVTGPATDFNPQRSTPGVVRGPYT